MITTALGRDGENYALGYLENKGMKCIARNFRSGHGEIDLIVQDGKELVFVEVKTRAAEVEEDDVIGLDGLVVFFPGLDIGLRQHGTSFCFRGVDGQGPAAAALQGQGVYACAAGYLVERRVYVSAAVLVEGKLVMREFIALSTVFDGLHGKGRIHGPHGHAFLHGAGQVDDFKLV